VFLFYLILALALLTNWVTIRLRRLPIGRAWEALREDEVACRALGINTTTTKLTAFATGAMFGVLPCSSRQRQGFIARNLHLPGIGKTAEHGAGGECRQLGGGGVDAERAAGDFILA